MTGKSSTVIENSYFSLKRAGGDATEAIYWDALRKAPLLSGAAPELLELIAAILHSGAPKNYILLPPRDYPLFNELQVIGCTWVGYAVHQEAEKDWDLWGSPASMKIIETSFLESALESDDTRIDRIVVEVTHGLAHDPRWGTRDYLEFVRSRERYFAGLSATNYFKSRGLWCPPNQAAGQLTPSKQSPMSHKRAHAHFADVTSRRASAQSFDDTLALGRNDLESIFIDAYYRRPDGHCPVATAGGLSEYRLWVVSDDPALNDAAYTVDAQSREWTKSERSVKIEDLLQSAFTQEIFKNCRTWLAIESDLHPLAEKYGNRAYRFAVMGAGALLQTLHLSSTSYGMKFRAVGGFDDGMLENLLGLPKDGYRRVFALAGLGK